MRRCWNWEGTNSRQIKCRRWKLSRETTIARWRTAISATTTTTAGPSTPMETAAAAIRPFITIRRQWWLPRLPPPRRQSTKDPSIIIASSGSTIPTAFCRQRRPAPIPARPVKTLLKETTNRPRRLTPLCSALGLNNRRRLRHHHHQRPPHRPAAVRHKKPTNRPLVTTFFVPSFSLLFFLFKSIEWKTRNFCIKTVKYNRRNNPELEKRRIHHCDFPGCTKVYTKSSHLKAHQRIHTGSSLLFLFSTEFHYSTLPGVCVRIFITSTGLHVW